MFKRIRYGLQAALLSDMTAIIIYDWCLGMGHLPQSGQLIAASLGFAFVFLTDLAVGWL